MRSYKFLVASYRNVGKVIVIVLRVFDHDVNPSILKNSFIETKEA